MEKNKKKIIILTPIGSKQDELLAEKNHKNLRQEFPFLTSTGLTVDASRNFLIKQAKDIGADKILFLDADIEPPKNIFRLFRCKEKIVSGIYWRFYEPKVPLAFILKDGEYIPINVFKTKELRNAKALNRNELVEVDMIGMGCCLIDLSIFDKIEEPWYKFIFDTNTSCGISEDFYFCSKVREKFKIFLDPRVKCAHIGYFKYYSPKKILPF